MAKARKARSGLETSFQDVDPKQITLLGVNARYMHPATFQRLVANIKQDGCLTSVPLCYRKGKKLHCISGNHRTKAAIEAGIKSIHVQIITSKITNDEFISKQLSHNALAGLDNDEILRKLWHDMDSAEAKLYSGLDKATIEKIEMPVIPPINIGIKFEQITLLFIGPEKEQIKKTLEEIKRRGILSKENWIESLGNYDEIAKLIQELLEREGVHNMATIILKMAEYAQEYMKLIDAGEVTQATRSTSS